VSGNTLALNICTSALQLGVPASWGAFAVGYGEAGPQTSTHTFEGGSAACAFGYDQSDVSRDAVKTIRPFAEGGLEGRVSAHASAG